MNQQESIQILEEMGLDKEYRCPSCNEILIHKIKKTLSKDGKVTIYKCTHCNLTFRIMICRICKKTRYSHTLNICTECFKKIRLPILSSIQEKILKDYKKLILVKCRKKPDIKFTITKQMYNKIVLQAIDRKCTKADIVFDAIKKLWS